MKNLKSIKLCLIILVILCLLSPLIVKLLFCLGTVFENWGWSGIVIYGFDETDVLSFFIGFWTFLATAFIGYLTFKQEQRLSDIEEKRFIKENTPKIINFSEKIRVDWHNWWFSTKTIYQNESVLYEVDFDDKEKSNARYIAGDIKYKFLDDLSNTQIQFRIPNAKIKFETPRIHHKPFEFYPEDNDVFYECTSSEGNIKGIFIVLVFNKYEELKKLNLRGEDYCFTLTLRLILKSEAGVEYEYLCEHKIAKFTVTELIDDEKSSSEFVNFPGEKPAKKEISVIPYSAMMKNILIQPQGSPDYKKGTQL